MVDDEINETDEPAPDDETAEPPPEMTPPPPAATGYQSMPNLAVGMPVAKLKAIAAKVFSDAESDYKSTEEWRQTTANHYKLYAGDPGETMTDQKNITIVSLPYTRRGVRMFHSKMFPQLYPPTKELLALSAGPGLEEVATRCANYMNHQCYNLLPEYIPSHDRGMTQELLEGSIFEVWGIHPLEHRPRQEICLCEDVWIPYKAKCDRPDLADVPRITWRRRFYQHELEAMETEGYYIGITKAITDGSASMDPIFGTDYYDEAGAPKHMATPLTDSIDDKPVKDQADREVGHERQDPEPDGEREILEQDRYLRLPGETKQRAVTICLDRQTMTILRIAIREREDLTDKERHNRETQQWQAETESRAAMFEAAANDWQAGQQSVLVDDGFGGIAEQPGPAAGQPPPEEPPPLPEPAPVKMIPWHRWTKYDCSMNPQGALGHGVPHDLAGHNQLANKVGTRAISQMTLNMLPTLLGSRQSKFLRGEVELQLGAINQMDLPLSQVQAGAGFFRLDFPPPDPNWFKAIEMADKSCQEVTAFDIAMGAPGMSGETATEAEMRHSNATDNISEVAQRHNLARAISLKNLAYINSVILPDEGDVVYRSGQEIRVFREDFEVILGSMEIIFTCDPNLESKMVKVKKAERLFNTVTQTLSTGPIPAIDPNTTVLLIRGAAIKMLEAADAPPEWIEAIKAAPMPGPPMQPGGTNGQPGETGPGKQPGGPPGGNEAGAAEAPPNPSGSVPS